MKGRGVEGGGKEGMARLYDGEAGEEMPLDLVDGRRDVRVVNLPGGLLGRDAESEEERHAHPPLGGQLLHLEQREEKGGVRARHAGWRFG